MVLYLKEFKEEKGDQTKRLNYYDKLPKYLHEMSVEEIIKHINRFGEKSRLVQQGVIVSYLQWLNSKYDVDCTDLFFNLKNALQNDENKSFVGFYSLSEMQKAIADAEFVLEDTSNSDWDGLYAVFYLEWYGVKANSIVSIKLRDVTNDGKIIYVPAEKRMVIIDNPTVADFFMEYKQKEGFQRYKNSEKIIEYKQDTFIRTTMDAPINKKTIYNLRCKFIRFGEDKRFEKNNVYNSGRYNALYQEELKLNDELSSKHKDIIQEIFHQELSDGKVLSILRNYNVYKQHLIKGLN